MICCASLLVVVARPLYRLVRPAPAVGTGLILEFGAALILIVTATALAGQALASDPALSPIAAIADAGCLALQMAGIAHGQ